MSKAISKVLICDDHYLTALGIEMILTNQSPAPVTILKATTGKAALELHDESSPDLLVLDLNLPDMSGLEVIRKIREAKGMAKIIVLTGQNEAYLLRQVYNLKVNGLLKKSNSEKNLFDALHFIRTNESNRIYLDTFMQSILEDEEIYVPTKREYEVLELMTQGLTSERIAQALECSVATVKTYRSRIMEKSGSRNSAEMIAWFLKRHGKDGNSSGT